MNAIYFNYALLIQFATCAGLEFYAGNYAKSTYWLGAFICTLGVTLA